MERNDSYSLIFNFTFMDEEMNLLIKLNKNQFEINDNENIDLKKLIQITKQLYATVKQLEKRPKVEELIVDAPLHKITVSNNNYEKIFELNLTFDGNV